MNILIVPSWFKTKSNPTLGSFFYEQAQMLNRMGDTIIIADVTLQSRKDYFSGRCYRLQKNIEGGIYIYSYVIPALGRFKTPNGGTDTVYRNLKKLYHEIVNDGFKIDIIHAHSYMPAGVAAIRLAQDENVPAVVTEHSSELLEGILSNDVRVALLSEVVDNCVKFICVSRKLKEAVQNITKCDSEKLLVVPNVVDSMFRYKPSNEDDSFTFISIGNLVQSKRFDLTIEAFSKTFSQDENVKLKIVGDGPLKKELEKKVNKLGENERIFFCGRVDRSKVMKFLQESNCMVLPSDYETFGVVYIESIAVGNPVIATKNGGAEDIITAENGILIDRDDLNQLCNAMRKIYNEIDKYDRNHISLLAIKKYGELAIGNELHEIYERILRTQAASRMDP